MTIRGAFNNLTIACKGLEEVKEMPLAQFTKEAVKVANAAKDFFEANSNSFSGGDSKNTNTAQAMMEASKVSIIDKLQEYTVGGEYKQVEFDAGAKRDMLAYFESLARNTPRSDFSMRIDHIIDNLRRNDERNNTIIWSQVEKTVDAFEEIKKHCIGF